MAFSRSSIRGAGRTAGAGAGTIDYRLRRQSLIDDFRKKRLAQHEVCDAHPELVRAAQEVGEPTRVDCPICEEAKVVLLTYVFGPRLPPHGRCVTTRREFLKLDRRPEELAAYVVEVCPSCRWNHLARVLPVGGKGSRGTAGRSRPAADGTEPRTAR